MIVGPNRSLSQVGRDGILAAVADPNVPEDTLLSTICCYCGDGEIRKPTHFLFRDIPVVFWTAWCGVCGTQIDEDVFIR